jgi:hypothetical protein
MKLESLTQWFRSLMINSFIIKTKVIDEEQERLILKSLSDTAGVYEIMRNEGVGPMYWF